ncbi:hypothetical protein HN588_02310 [Candidatus Bathyarchaeota archaeon]|nr:hypothetical protein [Candidatus Bathyarchaeota archaeon]
MSEEVKSEVQVPATKSLVDRCLEKAISRKLLVFVVATSLLLANTGLDSETWGWVALVYIGGQSTVDAVKAYRGA